MTKYSFDISKVISWSNSEEAKTYIGKTGYFNNEFEGMKRAIELGGPAVLGRVDTNSIWCFEGLGVSLCFGLFLPADKVKDVEEKKYRPFKNTDEFRDYLGFNFIVNLSIKIEEKITSERYELAIIGFFKNGLVLPIYCDLTFEELFRKFNICIDDKWQPFGVKE